jgi:hypothetical protein
MGAESKVYKVLMGKTEGKRPLGKPMRRWEDSSRGSSVSIVPGYGLDDRAIEVRSLAEAKVFFL